MSPFLLLAWLTLPPAHAEGGPVVLGIHWAEITESKRAKLGLPTAGIKITAIDKKCPARDVFESQDILQRIADQDIKNYSHYFKIMRGTPPNVPVEVVFYRDKERRTATITPVANITKHDRNNNYGAWKCAAPGTPPPVSLAVRPKAELKGGDKPMEVEMAADHAELAAEEAAAVAAEMEAEREATNPPKAAPVPVAQTASIVSDGRLAVLEFRGDLKQNERRLLSDEARGAVVGIVSSDVSVMTRENMEVMLSDQGIDASCVSEGACEVETARNLGVDYVMTGEIGNLAGTYVLSLKLHEVRTGKLIAATSAEGANSLELKRVIQKTVDELLAD